MYLLLITGVMCNIYIKPLCRARTGVNILEIQPTCSNYPTFVSDDSHCEMVKSAFIPNPSPFTMKDGKNLTPMEDSNLLIFSLLRFLKSKSTEF